MFFKKVYGPFTLLLRDKQPRKTMSISSATVAVFQSWGNMAYAEAIKSVPRLFVYKKIFVIK